MRKNPLEKFADKLLHRDKKGQDLKKYNLDLSGVLGEGINQKEIQHNENRKLIGLTKTCLMNKIHFWINKKGDHSSRIAFIERDIKIANELCNKINSKTYTTADIDKLKLILAKHNCV
jgi:hypothetical protein